jgi:glutamine amidotransferase
MPARIAIIHYGTSNVQSVLRRLQQAGAGEVMVTSSAEDLKLADKIILPGVGHFGKAMEHLHTMGLVDALSEAALIDKKPVLGICLGMQLMAGFSEEGQAPGLGWFDARVCRFQIENRSLYKVPHMGWNTAASARQAPEILAGIPDDAAFYFVHSYHVVPKNPADILTTTPYEREFVSAIQKDNITGVQFHPEKSHQAGNRLLKNFLEQ